MVLAESEELMADWAVRKLRNRHFSGIEGGSQGSLPWRVWWNGRITAWCPTQEAAEWRWQQIVDRKLIGGVHL